MTRTPIALAATVLITSTCVAQQVWHVDENATPGGDGLSWASAMNDLQSALAASAFGDEIWIAEGVYTPSDTDQTVSFVLVDGVSMYGGFSGNETQRDQRDPAIYQSILSGDVGRDDLTDPEYQIVGWNSGHVIVASGVSPATVLDGLTIERGATGPAGTFAGDPLMWGSGLYSIGGSPTINNCLIRHNQTAWGEGGGMYFRDASPVITNSVFRANYGHLSDGAAIGLSGTGGALIEDCEFWWNQLVFSTPDSMGGAISHQSSGQLTVRRCVFDTNLVRPFYWIGDDLGYGGAISSFWGPLLVEDSIFKNNTATIGGAIIAWNEAKIVNCLFDTNHAVSRESTNFEIGGFGGGFAGYTFTPRDMFIENCTFVNNTSKEHGGASGAWNSNLVISNSIFWNNDGWNPDFNGYYREHIGGSFDLRYCLIPGIFGPPAFGEDPMDPESLPGCIENDPLFVGGTDYRLSAASPAIDAGENAGWTSLWTTDLDGNPRFVDDPATADTGAGVAPVIDMGAYEFQVEAPCPADLTGDGVLDLNDINAFVTGFVAQDPIADLAEPFGVFDLADLAAFASSFIAGCP